MQERSAVRCSLTMHAGICCEAASSSKRSHAADLASANLITDQ